MNEKLLELVESFKGIEGIIGIAVYSKFGNIEYSHLPSWIDPKSLLESVNAILEVTNKATRKLRRGEFIHSTIESKDGNILISKLTDQILVIIANKDVKIKFFDKAKVYQELEFKT